MKFHLQVALFSRDFNCKGGTNTGTFTFSREAYLPADTSNFYWGGGAVGILYFISPLRSLRWLLGIIKKNTLFLKIIFNLEQVEEKAPMS